LVKEIVVALSRTALKRIGYTFTNIGVVILGCVYLIESESLTRALIVFVAALILANLQIWYIFRLKPKRPGDQDTAAAGASKAPSRTVLKLVSYSCANVFLIGGCAIYHFVLDQSLTKTAIVFALSLAIVNWLIWNVYRPKTSQ
jgi:hypothetical protein